MTGVNNGTSGMAASTRKSKTQVGKKGRPKKSTAEHSVSNDIDEIVCCKCEEVFVDEGDKLLECERCDNWFCIKCVDLEESVYTVMISNKNLHWFCTDCEKPALTAVKSDKNIGEKCAAYMSTITGRLGEIEEKVDRKADKCVVEDLSDRLKCLEQRTEDNISKPCDTDTVRETIAEQREREFRVRNLIIQNLPESQRSEFEDRQEEDLESVEVLLKVMGIQDNAIVENCVRIGKLNRDRTRNTKVTVNSVDVKRRILKSSRTLKDKRHYENIFFGPDLTKMQREQEYKLRVELRDRKERGEADIFIRGGRIVQKKKERALQDKGGAARGAASTD